MTQLSHSAAYFRRFMKYDKKKISMNKNVFGNLLVDIHSYDKPARDHRYGFVINHVYVL